MEIRDCARYKTFYTLHRFITDAFITLNNSQFQKSFGVYILALFSKLDHYINVKKNLIKKLFGVNLLTLFTNPDRFMHANNLPKSESFLQ